MYSIYSPRMKVLFHPGTHVFHAGPFSSLHVESVLSGERFIESTVWFVKQRLGHGFGSGSVCDAVFGSRFCFWFSF